MVYEDFKYSSYLTDNQETRWATIDEIRGSGTYINLETGNCPTAGLPLISNGKELYVDSQDTHTMIFGATGSKKTRLFCMPMLNIFAAAGESFVVTDPKGELYARTSGYVAAQGYQLLVLNFRNIGYGDNWNPLYLPYKLYHEGHVDKATTMFNDFVSALAAPFEADQQNRYFYQMAKSYIMAVLLFMVETGTAEQMTVGNLARLCTPNNTEIFKKLCGYMSNATVAGLNFQSVLHITDRTLSSILSTLYSMINDFSVHQDVMRMISANTIQLESLGRKRTAVYLIIPDEKTTTHFLATSFVKQAYEVLITEAQKERHFKLPRRVNFVLDEFCNIPTIADMPAMITAARSRNMRFFLVAQSLHQLRGKYGEDANTIKGNCDNWVFLTSKEHELLTEISQLCGQIRLPNGFTRNLISTSELQRLKKEKGEALILHGREYPFISEIADIDQYTCFDGYPGQRMRRFQLNREQVIDLADFYDRFLRGEVRCPFAKDRFPMSPVNTSDPNNRNRNRRKQDTLW